MFMGFRRHPELEGQHAFLSASKYSWLRYDREKLLSVFRKHRNAQVGTRKHELAKELIELGIKLQATSKTLNMYVNDSIGWRMEVEKVLAYSYYIFGTVDAIKFSKLPRTQEYIEFKEMGYENVLRINDLKTGETPSGFDQLLIYAALFFLEYKEDPASTLIELRIYQNDDIELLVPSTSDIIEIMDHIKFCDEVLEAEDKNA